MTGPFADPEFTKGLRPVPSGLGSQPPPWPATDLSGVDPAGRACRVDLADLTGALVLAFLATHCDGCESFWRGLGPDGPLGTVEGLAVVVVTKGPALVDPATVRELASGLGPVPVVMSDEVWAAYRVGGYPFFVLVDPGSRCVVRELVAFGMSDVVALVHAGA